MSPPNHYGHSFISILLPLRRERAANFVVDGQLVLSIAGLVNREAMQSLRAISPRATEEKLKQPMSTTAVDYYESTVFSERCQIPKFLTICFNSYLRFRLSLGAIKLVLVAGS